MNPLLQEFLMVILRKWLTMGAMWLVAEGYFSSQADTEKYVAGFTLLFVSFMWSFWNKYKGRINFLMALQTPPGTPEDEVRAKAKVFPPSVLALVLGVSVGLVGCAGKAAPVLVAQASLGLAQSIGALQVGTSDLQRANAIDVKTAISVQEKLLVINTKLATVVPILKAIDRVQQSGVKPTMGDVDMAMSILVSISAQISTILQGVPVSETTRAIVDLVQQSQTTVALTMVEIARLRAALEK